MITQEMEEHIQSISPGAKPGEPDWDAPAFLFSLIELPSCHPAKISKSTGIDRKRVDEYLRIAKKQGILQQPWSKGKYRVYAEWEDEQNGGVAFVLDVLAVQGLVERAEKKD